MQFLDFFEHFRLIALLLELCDQAAEELRELIIDQIAGFCQQG